MYYIFVIYTYSICIYIHTYVMIYIYTIYVYAGLSIPTQRTISGDFFLPFQALNGHLPVQKTFVQFGLHVQSTFSRRRSRSL